MELLSLAWPDRFFPFLFVVAEKRVWSGLQTHLVLTPSNVLINCIINTLVYSQKHEMWQTSLDFLNIVRNIRVFLPCGGLLDTRRHR